MTEMGPRVLSAREFSRIENRTWGLRLGFKWLS